jgi:hypothetical protein
MQQQGSQLKKFRSVVGCASGDVYTDHIATDFWFARNRITLEREMFEILVPVIMGGLIYILWRDTSLRMFDWAREIGIFGAINVSRDAAHNLFKMVPEFVVYSVPDALWTFSFARFNCALCTRGAHVGWLAVAPVISLGSELGQSVGIVPGTFDWLDLLLCCFALFLAFKLGGQYEIVYRISWNRRVPISRNRKRR